MKAVSILFAVVVVVSCIGVSMTSNKKSTKARAELEEERYLRMVAEEDLTKTRKKANSFEQKVKTISKKLDSLQRLLKQTETTNVDLKTRLDRQSQLNTTLENRIQELEKAAAAQAAKAPASIGG